MALPSPSTHMFTVRASPGMHRRGEAAVHALEAGRVAVAQRVQQGPAGEAVGAEAVEDGPVEAGQPANAGSECSGLRSPDSR